MTIDEYLEMMKITLCKFAKKCGVSNSMMCKLRKNNTSQGCSKAVAEKIVIASKGKIRFKDLPITRKTRYSHK